MSMNPTNSLNEIAQAIIAKGQLDLADLTTLAGQFDSDSVIDQHKAELLFQIDSMLQDGTGNCQQWQRLFSQSISRYVVFDMNSPGEIAECESEWLRRQIPDDRPLSGAEIELLRELQRCSISCCEKMKSLYGRVQCIEQSSAGPEADGNQ